LQEPLVLVCGQSQAMPMVGLGRKLLTDLLPLTRRFKNKDQLPDVTIKSKTYTKKFPRPPARAQFALSKVKFYGENGSDEKGHCRPQKVKWTKIPRPGKLRRLIGCQAVFGTKITHKS